MKIYFYIAVLFLLSSCKFSPIFLQCSECDGEGEVKKRCSECGGSGRKFFN